MLKFELENLLQIFGEHLNIWKLLFLAYVMYNALIQKFCC